MSVDETGAFGRLAEIEHARRLVDAWAEGLAQVFESMAGEKPEVAWQPAGPSVDMELLWWEQPLQVASGAAVWVGASSQTWEHAGALTLKAAGIETVEPAEAKGTWLEILGQSLSAMARWAGSLLGREVACDAGAERAPGAQVRDFASVSLRLTGAPDAPLVFALSPQFLDLIGAVSGTPAEAASGVADAGEAAPSRPRSRTMDLLMEIELPVSISFGKMQLPMRDVLKLTTGSIVELDRDVNEPVDVLVNRCLIARGEVVVVEGNYGVRIQQIASRQDRLRSVR